MSDPSRVQTAVQPWTPTQGGQPGGQSGPGTPMRVGGAYNDPSQTPATMAQGMPNYGQQGTLPTMRPGGAVPSAGQALATLGQGMPGYGQAGSMPTLRTDMMTGNNGLPGNSIGVDTREMTGAWPQQSPYAQQQINPLGAGLQPYAGVPGSLAAPVVGGATPPPISAAVAPPAAPVDPYVAPSWQYRPNARGRTGDRRF